MNVGRYVWCLFRGEFLSFSRHMEKRVFRTLGRWRDVLTARRRLGPAGESKG